MTLSEIKERALKAYDLEYWADPDDIRAFLSEVIDDVANEMKESVKLKKIRPVPHRQNPDSVSRQAFTISYNAAVDDLNQRLDKFLK